MKKLMLLVLLLSPIFLISQNSNRVFKDTVHVSELFTDEGKNMFSGNSIISDKTFCNGRMCIWWSVGNFDTLIYKSIFEGELFTGMTVNIKDKALLLSQVVKNTSVSSMTVNIRDKAPQPSQVATNMSVNS